MWRNTFVSMKIEEYLEWEDPQIWIEEGDFEISIEKDEVEITCNWDGYSGRGTERMTINRRQLIEILLKIEK